MGWWENPGIKSTALIKILHFCHHPTNHEEIAVVELGDGGGAAIKYPPSVVVVVVVV